MEEKGFVTRRTESNRSSAPGVAPAEGSDATVASRNAPAIPYRSEQSTRNQIARAVWSLAWAVFCRLSPRPLHGWRRWWLRLFGARVHSTAAVYPSARI